VQFLRPTLLFSPVLRLFPLIRVFKCCLIQLYPSSLALSYALTLSGTQGTSTRRSRHTQRMYDHQGERLGAAGRRDRSSVRASEQRFGIMSAAGIFAVAPASAWTESDGWSRWSQCCA
jgi:hypothetical protein